VRRRLAANGKVSIMSNIKFMKLVFAAAFLLAGLGARAGTFTNGSFEIMPRQQNLWVNSLGSGSLPNV